MYEDRFGLDWETLDDREEAVRRAFALGVAARLGERHPGELDRISETVDSSYDRSFVELAYHEGRDKASELEPDAEADEDVWDELVVGETRVDVDAHADAEADDDTESGLPDALDRVSIDTRPDDTREAMRKPKFLNAETAEEPDGRSRARRSRNSGGEDGDEERQEPTPQEQEALEEILEPDDEDEEN